MQLRHHEGLLVDPRFFVLHDVSNFPIVRVPAESLPESHARIWIGEMNALLEHDVPFVLISLGSSEDESQEDRKLRTLWLKANKVALASTCLGLISIEPDSDKHARRHAQAATLSKAFALRISVEADVPQAEQLARHWLRAYSDT
jgi:hypothetical protein